MPEAVALALAQAIPGTLDHTLAQSRVLSPEQGQSAIAYSGLISGDNEGGGTAEDTYIYASKTQTHELPLNKVDWAAIEEALEKKREEDARMMAHNQLIQDVFSKIQNVENRVMGDMRKNNDQ
jgi:transcription initiation factor IIF auxiliary subunit